MRRTTTILIGGALAVALAACGGRDEDQAGAARGDAADAAATSPDGMADAPALKTGLWEQTLAVEGQPPMTLRLCVDESTDDVGGVMGARTPQETCSERKVSPAPGGGWNISLVCDQGTGGTVRMEGTMKGDFSSAYSGEYKTSVTGAAAPQMNVSQTMKLSGQYQGDCPAGMTPGAPQIEMGGVTIDMSGYKGAQ